MAKKQVSAEQKKLDTDLWIIMLVTLGAFLFFTSMRDQLMNYIKNSDISVTARLAVNAGVQFGIAGLGITVVCILRREKFTSFGLTKRNTIKAIAGTVLWFIPYIIYVFISGQFNGYQPFDIIITKDVTAAGLPLSILGLAVIAVVWGFFEGFNYAVICEKINRRYPSPNRWLDYGAISCAVFCLLFHPFSTSFWGIVEMITTFLAIYGMLRVRRKTENAWGCIFAFCFIWNAL